MFRHTLLLLTGLLSLTAVTEARPQISPEELAKRQCRSVHLGHHTREEFRSAYAEIEVEKSAPGTYFCVLGFSKGYFGIQELPNNKKVVIFSVWEPNHGEDPTKVPESKRTKLVKKGEGVRTGRFGNEGTGGQSFFQYDWKDGEKIQFVVTAEPNEAKNKTTFTGWFYDNHRKQWQLMTSFQTLTQGERVKGIYHFVEDFRRNYKSAKISRKARYKNLFVQKMDGSWEPVLKLNFTADPTPSDAINAGVVENGFFLQTGGDTKTEGVKLWGSVKRDASKATVLPDNVKTLPLK